LIDDIKPFLSTHQCSDTAYKP